MTRRGVGWILAGMLAGPVQAGGFPPGGPPGPGSPGQTVAPATPDDAEAIPRQRPQPCIDGTVGRVRIQIGSVEAYIEVGKEIRLPVRVKGVCDLAAFTLGIQLDRHIAELVRFEQTPFLQGDPPVDLAFQGIDPARSVQVVRVSRPAGSGGVDGVGTLVRLIVRGRTPGATQIVVIRPRLFDPAGEAIESFAVPVRLTVIGPRRGLWRPHSTPLRKPQQP